MIHKREIIKALGICPRTFARWCKDGKVPPADTDINPRSQWWHIETLEQAGIRVGATETSHAASGVAQ